MATRAKKPITPPAYLPDDIGRIARLLFHELTPFVEARLGESVAAINARRRVCCGFSAPDLVEHHYAIAFVERRPHVDVWRLEVCFRGGPLTCAELCGIIDKFVSMSNTARVGRVDRDRMATIEKRTYVLGSTSYMPDANATWFHDGKLVVRIQSWRTCDVDL